MPRALRVLLVAGTATLLVAAPAAGHSMPTSSVLLDIGKHEVSGEIELPLDRLAVARQHPISAAQAAGPERASLEVYVAKPIAVAGTDGTPWTVRLGRATVLTYIDGKTIDSSPVSLSDGRLVSAAQLIRRFHDTTAGTALVQTGRREPSPISALNCRCRRAVEASGRWSLPYAAPAWRGGQPALGVA